MADNRRNIHPLHSKKKVSKAANNIRECLCKKSPLNLEDENIVENWRSSHVHILNTWQINLKRKIEGMDVVFAQRLKRRNTIYDKLRRQPNMNFSRMQDIAGCRLVFKNYNELIDYKNKLNQSKNTFHELKQTKDYISEPKESGYRGIHDIYSYKNRKRKGRSNEWDGLLLEIQYRTVYQHAWATAVEVADNITKSRVKFNESEDSQKSFFKLASEIISRVYENRKSCSPELSNTELVKQFKDIDRELNLLHKLKVLKILSPKISKNKNIIIHSNIFINTKNPITRVSSFDSFSQANIKYLQMEKEFPNDDIVLVRTSDRSVDKTIKNAFRNYFSDAKDFVDYIEQGLKRLSKNP